MKKKQVSALALFLLIGVLVPQIGANDLPSSPVTGYFDDYVLAYTNPNYLVGKARVFANSEPWLEGESSGCKAGGNELGYCPESVLSTAQRNFIDETVLDASKLRKALTGRDENIFHLVSHGKPGQLFLEGNWLNATQIVQWLRQSYSLQGLEQLNIYGCEFAKGQEGRAAVAYLKLALGISVAASDDITGFDGDWNLEIGGNGRDLTVVDYQYNLQLDNPDWGDNVTGCIPDALLYPGVAVVTCGVVEELAPTDRYVVAYMSLNAGLTATARDTITNADSVVHHSDWLVSSIGNVFGTAVKQSTAEVFVTASSNYGAGFGFFNNSAAVLNYGSIGGADEVVNAGHIYRIDPVSGAVTIFATLPQASTTVEHWDCEFNVVEISRSNSGVGLGNIVYDEINDQFFVSNTEDGRIYRLSNTGAILDSYDPLVYDTGSPGIDDLEDVPYGLAVEPGSNRLFFGVVDDPGSIPPAFDGNPPGFALQGDPSIYSIDLNPSGGFSGTINNTVLPAGVPNNYVGTDVFHATIPTSEPGARSFTNHTIYFISDLAFNPDGELMAGVRVGCHGSWHSSYNHWGETNFLTLNTGTNLYGNPTEYDVSATGDAGIDDSYGGVATFDPQDGSCQVYYSNSSADIVAEPGPHGVTLWESSLTNNPITPIAIFEYGVLPSDDPKGIGGDVEIFNGCSLSCNIAGDTEVCAGDDLTLTYTPDCPDNLFTWAITSGDATISGANNETMVTITAGTGDYTVTLFPAQSTATCTYDVTVDPLPVVTLTDPADVCVDGSDLDFTATPAPAIGTMGVFSTTASGGLTDNNNGTATLDVSTAGAGTYDVSYTYTDVNGCTAAQTVSVTINPLPVVELIPTVPECGNSDGAIDLNTISPNPIVSYSWVETGSGTTYDTEDLTNLSPGNYSVTVTDNMGCEGTASVDLFPPGGCCETDISITDISPCVDGNFEFSVTLNWVDAPTTGDLQYSVDGGPYLDLARTNFDTDAMGEDFLVPDLICSESRLVSFRFADQTACFVEAMFVFPPTDPAGFFYCVETGEIIPGGSIDVVPPMGGSFALVDSQDGTDGRYAWVATGSPVTAGTYQMTVTPPMDFTLIGTPGQRAGDTDDILDPTFQSEDNPMDEDPLLLGSDANMAGDQLLDFSEAANPFFLEFSLEQDDPFVDNNNIPLEGCVIASLAIGSTVFEDQLNNGIQDGGDQGLANVEARLFQVIGNKDDATNGETDDVLVDVGSDGDLATPTDGLPYETDAAGNYLFQSLAPGDYYIVIPAAEFGPGGDLEMLDISSTNIATSLVDNQVDGDDNGLQPAGRGTLICSPVISLAVGDEPTDAGPNPENAQGGDLDNEPALIDANGDMTIDFGLFAPVAIGDTTFVDIDENGVQDPGDPPLPGVTVTLFTAAGDPVTTDVEGNSLPGGVPGQTTTNGDGFYEFTNLPPGDYYVVFDLSTVDGAELYTFTSQNQGDPANDSDADPTSGQSGNTGDIPSGTRFNDLDAGVICNIEVEVANPSTICATRLVDLTAEASITPAGLGGYWTSSGNGTFLDAGGNALAPDPMTGGYPLGVAVNYQPSAMDAQNEGFTLTLTTNDPNTIAPSSPCAPVSESVFITVLGVDCGSYPWSGDD